MSGPGAVAAALGDLLRRSGGLRHPVATIRTLRRFGGTLPAVVELGARRFPDRIALVDGVETRYAALGHAVRATAAALARRSSAGAVVGVRTTGGADTVILLAAAVRAGLDVVPLGARLPDVDVDEIAAREGIERMLRPDEHVRHDGPVDAEARRVGRLRMLSTGSTGLARATRRGRLGLRALVPMADLDRRIRWPRGALAVLPPLDHGHGLSGVIAGLLRGETVILGAALDPAALAAAVAAHRPTAVTGVPLQLARAVDAGVFDGTVLRRIVSGSSRLDDAVAARLRERTGASIIDCLGTTETGTFAVREPPGAFRPLAATRITVDGAGRILVRTPLATGERATGDEGSSTSEGLRLHGRADGLVDTAGELVSPERVERALRALSMVRACTVEVHDDELRGAVVIARVHAASADVTATQVRAALLPVLGRAAVPHRIDVHHS